MSKLLSLNESRASILNSLVSNKQLPIDNKSFIGKDSTDKLLSDKSAINIHNNNIANDLKVLIKKTHTFPLTERSKRIMAAKIRIERERKSEQINKINETITLNAKIIKNHLREKHVKKLQGLKIIKNNQWHYDRSSLHDSPSQSLNDKIETLESNIKQLKIELMMEKNRLISVEENSVVDNQNFMSDENSTNTNSILINLSEEIIEKNFLNSIESSVRQKCIGVRSMNIHVSNSETRLIFSPKHVEFKMSMKSNIIKIISKQQIKVTNRSKSTILCRYSHLFDPNSILQDNTNIIKVNTDALCRLQPGITVNYVVTFKPTQSINSITYLSLNGVKLVFETESHNQPDVKHSLHIPIKFCIVKPEPELVTKTINFPALHDRNDNTNHTKYLILKNNGDVQCIFSVIKETDYQRKYNTDDSNNSVDIDFTKSIKNDSNLFKDIIDSIVYKMFNYFMWKNHINVILPAKGSVKIPVIFNTNFACSSISECYIIEFDNTEYIIPNQKVNIIGHINNQNILVIPDIIDSGLCYLTSSVQTVSFNIENKNRVVIPFVIKLPRELSKHVELSPSRGYLKAKSSLEICVRLCLKYDILRSNDLKMYFNADSGVLDFPIWVSPLNCKKTYNVRIIAIVSTSFGLKFTPDYLDFGTVNTTETVVRNIILANHSRATMEFGFLKLPDRVSVYPSAFGTIFSREEICLHVYYSPNAKILPPKQHLFEDDFILTCNTIAGLNADVFNSEIKANSQFHEIISEVISTSIKNSNSTISKNELDHGLDKIEISQLENIVEVDSLNTNAILKEATIKCQARIQDIPVELSVQKIIFGKTHFSSYSSFKFELRASNLASKVERNIDSFPDYKIRFEFVSNDPSIEFKPKNGILLSKEVVQISIIFRPMFDNELQNIYEECLNSEITNNEIKTILEDKNSFVNQVYKNIPFLQEKTKIFEGKKIFYSLMVDKTLIIPAVCFVQFVEQKSIEYFGFDTGSLKLSLVCPITKPNIILFSNLMNFGKCTIDVRHDEWLLVQNITMRPVPLRISLADPIGPFFCAFALKGEYLLSPGEIIPINISFIPEHEMTVYDILEVTSERMRLDVKLRGSGLKPSCKITPNEVFNIIPITHKHQMNNNNFVFWITNTGDIEVPFNVQMEWSKERLEPMTENEVYGLMKDLRENMDLTTTLFDDPDWTGMDDYCDVMFDLGNGGKSLRFRLDSGSERCVQVTFRSPSLPVPVLHDYKVDTNAIGKDSDRSHCNDGDRIFRSRVYVAKFNVHVGRSVLHQFYLIGFVDEII